MNKLLAVYRGVCLVNEWAGRVLSFLLLGLASVLVYEVTARYVFHSPTHWAHEMSIFLFGGSTVLAGGYVLLHKAHVNLDILYSRVSPRVQAILDLATAPFFFFIMVLLIWKGTDFALNSWRVLETASTIWEPPIYPFKTIIPIAAVLVLLQGAAKFMRDLFYVIRGSELE